MTQIRPYVRKINYYETDQMGIVHHSNYIRYFEEARIDYMDKIGFSYMKASETGIDFAVIEVRCTYKSMIKFGDTVNIAVNITELSNVRITLSYKITDAETGEMRSIGSTSHCFYDGNKKRPVSLYKSVPELYCVFEKYIINENNDQRRIDK